MKVLLAFLSRPWVQQLLALNVSFYGIGLATLLSGSTVEVIDAHCHASNVNFVQRMLALSNGSMTKTTMCFGNASTFEFAVEDDAGACPSSFTSTRGRLAIRSRYHA